MELLGCSLASNLQVYGNTMPWGKDNSNDLREVAFGAGLFLNNQFFPGVDIEQFHPKVRLGCSEKLEKKTPKNYITDTGGLK